LVKIHLTVKLIGSNGSPLLTLQDRIFRVTDEVFYDIS